MKTFELHKSWNKCDVCGRFISYEDFSSGNATREMILPDSDCSVEEYETLCKNHRKGD